MNREHRLDCVDEAAQASDLSCGEHEQDREDRDAVRKNGDEPGPPDRHRDVLLGVLHLVTGRARQLEPDEVEEKNGNRREEDGRCRRELAAADAVDAVLDGVQDHCQREDAEQGCP